MKINNRDVRKCRIRAGKQYIDLKTDKRFGRIYNIKFDCLTDLNLFISDMEQLRRRYTEEVSKKNG